MIVFGLLAAGVAALMGGFALVSRGATQGWIGVAVAIPMLLVAARSMRAVKASVDTTDVVDVVDTRARRE